MPIPSTKDIFNNFFFTLVIVVFFSFVLEMYGVHLYANVAFFTSGIFTCIYVYTLTQSKGNNGGQKKSFKDYFKKPVVQSSMTMNQIIDTLQGESTPKKIGDVVTKKKIMVSELDDYQKREISTIIAEDIFIQFLDSDFANECEIDITTITKMQNNDMLTRVDLRLPKSTVLSIPSYVNRRRPNIKQVYPIEEKMKMTEKEDEETFEITTESEKSKLKEEKPVTKPKDEKMEEKTPSKLPDNEPAKIEPKKEEKKEPSKDKKEPTVKKVKIKPDPIKISFIPTGEGQYKAIVADKKTKKGKDGVISDEELKSIWENDEDEDVLDSVKTETKDEKPEENPQKPAKLIKPMVVKPVSVTVEVEKPLPMKNIKPAENVAIEDDLKKELKKLDEENPDVEDEDVEDDMEETPVENDKSLLEDEKEDASSLNDDEEEEDEDDQDAEEPDDDDIFGDP